MNTVNIIKLDNSHIKLIEEFCRDSAKHGYLNNSSIEKMKFGGKYDLTDIPQFWGAMHNNKLVSVSGCHKWPSISNDVVNAPLMRCLFRSATLPEYTNLISGLSKNHMNSLPFSMLLPLQINYGLEQGIDHFYITTSNSDHDASGKMKKTHKAMQLLEQRSIVKYAGDDIIYSTSQTKWEINLDNYLEAVRAFYQSKIESNLIFDDEYISIVNNGFLKSWVGYTTPLE
jgi:hypothetical protein